jgi:formiminotetrahydrofolate cyclodeaminase
MKFAHMSFDAFIRELASESPAPGGGSAAAMTGAMAAALCGMVARLTAGKEKYREAWAAMEDMKREADTLAIRLLDLADDDTEAFRAVMSARRLPKGTDAERAVRERAIRDAVLRSAEVPLETLKSARSIARLAVSAVERGNPNCITDAGTAAEMAKAAAMGAAYNVRINLAGVKDPDLRGRIASETSDALNETRQSVERLERAVESRLETA